MVGKSTFTILTSEVAR
nr:unnamed protein product [Callosobruchus chinensis]